MTFTKSTTRVADAQELWTYQLKGKTVVDALTSLFATESQAWEEVAEDILLARAIDTAVGSQLDDLGVLVGQLREGRTDERYRVWIRARIAANRSSGSPVDMYKVAFLIFGQDATLWLRQFPVGHVLQDGAWSGINVYDVQKILQQTSPVAVPFYYWYAPYHSEVFTFAAGSTPVAASSVGFDGGRLRGVVGPGGALIDPVPSSGLVERFDIGAIRAAGATEELDGIYSELAAPAGEEPTATLGGYKEGSTKLTFSGTDALAQTTPASQVVDTFEGSAFTIACFFQPGGVEVQEWIMGCTVPVSYVSVDLYSNFTGANLYLDVYDGVDLETQNVLLTGSGPFVAVVVFERGSRTDFLVDGTWSRNGFTNAPTPDLTGATFALGNYAVEGDRTVPLDGLGGQFMVWNRALSDSEAETVSDYLTRKYTDTYS